MKLSAWLAVAVLAAWPHAAPAQQTAASTPLNDKQLLGMRLFNQSCRVCHTKPQLTSPLYGPALSRQSLGGQEDVDARGHQQRHASHAGLQASFRAAADRRHRRLPQDHPGARAVGEKPCEAQRLTLAVSAFVVALLGAPVQVNAADTILSGSIKSSAGEAMGGVMVSAKPEGGTITTTVLTDEAGRYYFPPLAAGKYRVWAQAMSFATAKGEIDLGAVKKAGLHASADGGFLPAIARQRHAVGAA